MKIVMQKLHSAGLVIFLMAILIGKGRGYAADELLIFAGAASKPPTEEVTRLYGAKAGVKIQTSYGGSGFILAQMKLARRGDIYFPGSSDFMEKAKREELVFAKSETIAAYLLPAINVQKGNPKKIRSLSDLARPGLRLAIAQPENVCVGTYAVEVLEKNLAPRERAEVRKNLVTMVESCEKTANIIALKAVDAVIGWRVFAHWDPERIETVLLQPAEVPRIGYLPAAVSRFTRKEDLAREFLTFLTSSEVRAVFKRHGYLMSAEEARALALPKTPVGGEYSLPDSWRRSSSSPAPGR